MFYWNFLLVFRGFRSVSARFCRRALFWRIVRSAVFGFFSAGIFLLVFFGRVFFGFCCCVRFFYVLGYLFFFFSFRFGSKGFLVFFGVGVVECRSFLLYVVVGFFGRLGVGERVAGAFGLCVFFF